MVLLNVKENKFPFIDKGPLVEPGFNPRVLVAWFSYVVANRDLNQQGFMF